MLLCKIKQCLSRRLFAEGLMASMVSVAMSTTTAVGISVVPIASSHFFTYADG